MRCRVFASKELPSIVCVPISHIMADVCTMIYTLDYGSAYKGQIVVCVREGVHSPLYLKMVTINLLKGNIREGRAHRVA